MPQIILEVTDEQLAHVKARLEEDGEFVIKNPLKLLQAFLANEVRCVDVYVEDDVLDNGGNSLGDVLEADVLQQLLEEGALELAPET